MRKSLVAMSAATLVAGLSGPAVRLESPEWPESPPAPEPSLKEQMEQALLRALASRPFPEWYRPMALSQLPPESQPRYRPGASLPALDPQQQLLVRFRPDPTDEAPAMTLFQQQLAA